MQRSDYTEEEWNNLVGFFEILIEIDRENQIIKKNSVE